MDSVAEDDITLPLDFDRSTNLARFKEAVAAGTGGDMLDSSAEFSEGLTVRPTTTGAGNQDGSGSPQTKTMKDYEYQISELKKENFGLKLRIYFLEERVNQNGDVPEDIFKANIELKVTVEKLKKELVERQELLVKASNAVEALAQHSDTQIRQLTEEHNEELREIREGYEIKLKEMEKDLAVARNGMEDMADKLAETALLNQQLNERLLESTDGFHDDQQQIQVCYDNQLLLTEEHNEELREIREGYEIKLKEMEKDLAVARNDVEDMADKLAETTLLNQQLNERLLESTDGFHDDQQQIQVCYDNQLGSLASTKEENKGLKDNLDSLKDMLSQQEQGIPQQNAALEINERKIQECEGRIRQLTEELESRNQKLEELKDKAKKTERTNRELRNQLHDKEREQHLNSRNSTDNLLSQSSKDGSRDSELQQLHTKVQDLNQSLTATREAAHTAKRKWYQVSGEGDIQEITWITDGTTHCQHCWFTNKCTITTSLTSKTPRISNKKPWTYSVLFQGPFRWV
ncbi:CDK5 regulatory subunit-associated protein 2-like [Orbicella faveolata]|uniref:CDK5 regulatory subunit-associated protein 2-like n=1 Tax=Orbicella faveolata TaxID=48498 RepID=UPI0009E5A689|nr:CDK5 regulatory subunit-associated protein 2-like [Orbicella faveolata]